MRYSREFGVLGALLYGFVGYELGVALVGTYELTTASAPIVWSAMFLGAALGYLLSPWLVIAPARAALGGLRGVPMSDLVAGTIGLAIGVLIAALLAYPISRLPPPFGANSSFCRRRHIWLSRRSGHDHAQRRFLFRSLGLTVLLNWRQLANGRML